MYQTVDGQGNITNHVVGSAPANQEAEQNAALGVLGSASLHPASDFVSVTTTVAGHALSSNVSLVKGDVGLGNVDNTADSAKPVSTAQATADTAIQSAAATDATTKANAAQAAAIAASLATPIVTNSTPATGETVSAGTAKKDETLYITPAGTLLDLTVALPTAANSRVGQIIRGFISQIITGLTMSVSGSGSLIGSLPITSAVNSSFAYQCVSVSGNGTWIRLY